MTTDSVDSLDVPDAVDILVAEYLDARDHGHAPTRSDWLGRYPEQANELSHFLDALEALSSDKAMRPADTSRLGETQAIPGENAAKDVASRSSETALWNKSLDSPDGLGNVVNCLPCNGSFGGYDLLETVARGGMGVVFKARERKLDRIVALKMILAGQLASEIDIQRFRAEAQAAARLDHPSIVAVYEVGEHQGLHYFTMAFIEGASLADQLRDGPLAPKEAARLVRDLAGAIEYAHQHGIVHRDLKPANVLIDQKGHAKLTDFGLAKRTHDVSEMTGTGQILGTPAYISPEQAQGNSSDAGPATDIYGPGRGIVCVADGPPAIPGRHADRDHSSRTIGGGAATVRPQSQRAARPGNDLPEMPGEVAGEALCGCATPSRTISISFLEDRPIHARPAGVIEKGWRWYRRRPMVGTMAAALALLLIAVPLLLAGFLAGGGSPRRRRS